MLLQHALSLQELGSYQHLFLLLHLLSCLQCLMVQLLQGHDLLLLLLLSFPWPVAGVCRPLSESGSCLLDPCTVLHQLLRNNAG